MPTLLILTNKLDVHADAVIRILAERKTVRPVRINTDDFMDNCQYTFRWSGDGAVVRTAIGLTDSGLSIEDIDVAWWRKPDALAPPRDLTHPEVVRVAVEEGNEIFRTLTAPFHDVSWVNDPWRIRRASPKLPQIQVAQAAGLAIPDTLVTNRGDDLVAFLREYGDCIIKPLKAAAFSYDEAQWGLYTSGISLAQAEEALTSVQYSPVLVQRRLRKALELRITIIGQQHFACAIESQQSACEDVRTDWRVISAHALPHRLVTIPPALLGSLRGILEHYGLNYGAFDVIQEPDGTYYFLELNPNGQYYWIELLTGARMSAAMADLIEQLAVPCSIA